MLKKNHLFLLFIFLFGCVDPFEFQNEEPPNLLIIDGQLTLSSEPHFVKLNLLGEFGSGPGAPVTGAEVVLFEEEGTQENYQEVEPGVYRLDGQIIQAKSGNTYFIEIQLSNGAIYRSIPEKMPTPIGLEQLDFAFSRKEVFNDAGNLFEQEVVDLFINTGSFPVNATTYLRWTYDEMYSFTDMSCGPLDPSRTCYIPLVSEPLRIELFTDENVEVDRLEQRQIGSKDFDLGSEEFAFKHYFSVFQHAIPKSVHTFWTEVAKVANREGSIFDAPPAAIQGNIRNTKDQNELVLGLFELAATDTIRKFVLREDLEIFERLGDYCPINLGLAPRECCNCMVLPGATMERPDWFE